MSKSAWKMFWLSCLLALAISSRLTAQQLALRPGETVEIRLGGVPAEYMSEFSAAYTIDPARRPYACASASRFAAANGDRISRLRPAESRLRGNRAASRFTHAGT